MQFKTFRITISSPERSEGELNAFLRGHRILSVERLFCSDQGGYWSRTFCAPYYAYDVYFESEGVNWGLDYRNLGVTVRAVRVSQN